MCNQPRKVWGDACKTLVGGKPIQDTQAVFMITFNSGFEQVKLGAFVKLFFWATQIEFLIQKVVKMNLGSSTVYGYIWG